MRMKKGKPIEEIFVVQEYIGGVRMESNMVERRMKDVEDVYVIEHYTCQVISGYVYMYVYVSHLTLFPWYM